MRYLLAVLTCCLTLQTAQAALFDDKEARKKIADVEQQVKAQNQTLIDLKASQQALADRLSALENVLKNQGLVDMLNQVDALNQEISRLKGELEVVQHQQELGQQRQKDLYADTDARLRKLEGGAPVANTNQTVPPANTGPVANGGVENPNEAKDFEAALALTKSGKHKDAFAAYEKFLQTYPNSSRAVDAQYQLGLSQFSLKNYKAAIATQEKLLERYPDSKRAPDAMYSIANCQIQLSDIESAKKTLRDLLGKHPDSEVAPNAKKRLTILEGIKTR